MLHMLCTERDGHSRACRIRNDVVVVMVVVAVSRLAYPHSTSTVFAYPGGNAAISYLFRASLRCLNSYAYEPFKLSLSLPASAGAGFALPSRRIAAFVWPLLQVRAVAGSLGAQLFTTTCSLYESSPPTAGTRRVWRTVALLTTRASCRVKVLRGICMCLPR